MSFNKHSSLDLTLKILTEPHGVLPYRSRPEDVGFDLTARQITPQTQRATDVLTFMVDFGVRIEPPAGYYAELIPRSSLTWTGFIMPNSVGVIDPDYRGILMMPLVYLGSPDQASVKSQELVGRRLAQLVLRPHYEASVLRVKLSELSATRRGESGFGSSGH